jgi:ABC-type xylose transport system permease subunit
VIFVIVVLVFDFLLRRITAFRLVCYTGSNEKAAAYSGIRTKRVITGCRLNAYFARFGHRFRAILGTRFTPSWAAISRMRAG